MTTNLPPQAYTRDTLVKAIEWLSGQPSTVRERATSADLIVSYYLQARRRTVVQMEAPVSGENFKTDLKHLAEDLKQFEEPSPPPTHATSRSSSLGPSYSSPVSAPPPHPEDLRPPHMAAVPTPRHEPPPRPSEPPIFHPEPMAYRSAPAYPEVQYKPEPPAPRPEAPKGVVWQVDARSLAAARELQLRFNLSSEGEALRMLVTLGTERARERMP